MEGWDTPHFSYDELNNPTGMMNPAARAYNNSNNISTMQPQNFLPPLSFMCKQELEAENLKFLHATSSDPFTQLPQLESSSLPIIKNNIPTSVSSDDNINNIKKVTTDWRDLDKFVASQLMSHDDEGETTKVSIFPNFENQSLACDSDDMGLLLLQSSREEADKLNGLLGPSSCSDFGDIGICIFDGKL